MNRKLDKLYNHSLVIPFDQNSKFIFFSDCHRGQGNTLDNFLPNQSIFQAALDYYYKNGYTYIEIGDGDELWENRKLQNITLAHQDTFLILNRFKKSNRLYMIYGNHDMVKKSKSFTRPPLFPEVPIHESLLLKSKEDSSEIFLLHGHQEDLFNGPLWPVGRWVVRYIWRPLELIGFRSPSATARSHKKQKKIELSLADYANERKFILIAGHTHRPVFSKPDDSFYFNDGCCIFPQSITGIEIHKGCISLVKWSIKPNMQNILFVAKDILEGPINLNLYFP